MNSGLGGQLDIFEPDPLLNVMALERVDVRALNCLKARLQETARSLAPRKIPPQPLWQVNQDNEMPEYLIDLHTMASFWVTATSEEGAIEVLKEVTNALELRIQVGDETPIELVDITCRDDDPKSDERDND
ncbi:hypothetical protein [Rhizobium gallicum]|uniref:hypothetical protein n=1 Tax=Rhizobium gallicum TaxID=56730 RepID=UPI001EF7B720|nr:hypothetical protein [Rhizobium gallicum]ULJ74200.1 hypothetical protein L2W42_22415 [Rhizobium gallicum]